MSTYAERVRAAVDDEDWQAFRKSLRGRPTSDKITQLEEYYDNVVVEHENLGGNVDACEECQNVVIRIDNYIKALCRGGQLEAGMTFDHFNDGCIRNHIRK